MDCPELSKRSLCGDGGILYPHHPVSRHLPHVANATEESNLYFNFHLFGFKLKSTHWLMAAISHNAELETNIQIKW